MSVWEKVFKNPKSKATLKQGVQTLSVPDIKLPRRGSQLPALTVGLAIGTTYTKRTFICQLGAESVRWTPENNHGKTEMSVFRIEKIISDLQQETSTGEEALNNFMSDRSDPACTLFLQPIRYLLLGGKPPPFVSIVDNQKILHQSPSNEELYKLYIKTQFRYLYETARKIHSQIPRFQLGQVVVEYPDYFTAADLKKYRQLMINAAQEFFPPVLMSEEESVDIGDHFTFMPESWITVLHWLTDNVEPKFMAQELDLKKLLAKHGILPRTSEPVNFLVVTTGATQSRVVRLKTSSFGTLLASKYVGQNVPIGHAYFGRTGYGGDHISCAFLEEEEERRYGANAGHRVSTLSRKVMEDWNKIATPEGKKHFDDLAGEAYNKALEKLGEIVLKGFGESPENTIIVLGGRLFNIPHFREGVREYLRQHRVPLARIVAPSTEENSLERACEIVQHHQKGSGRSFTFRSGDSEGTPKFTWRIGRIAESTLTDAFITADNKEWDAEHPREFMVSLEKTQARNLNLGYQKGGGSTQMWATISLKPRVIANIQLTFITEGPDDLRIKEVKSDAKTTLTPEDFEVKMLLTGEHPSNFPLYDKILKSN